MKLLVSFLLCLCIFQFSYVNSTFVETIKSGAHELKNKAKCGFHKVKNFFYEHEHQVDPCKKNEGNDNDDGETTTLALDIRGPEDDLETSYATVRPRRSVVAPICRPGYKYINGRCYPLIL